MSRRHAPVLVVVGLVLLECATAVASANYGFASSTPNIAEFGGLSATTCCLRGIAAGPDGSMWATEQAVDRLARISPSGTVTEFALPAQAGGIPASPWGITAGPTSDPNSMWFTELNSNKIGRLDLGTDAFAEFTIPNPVCAVDIGVFSTRPEGITAGPDGNLWFTETCQQNERIGEVTTTGSFTQYAITTGSDPEHITSGPDGALWFTEQFASQLGRITTAGQLTEIPIASTGGNASAPLGITTGPTADPNSLWFIDSNGLVGRVDSGPSHAIVEYGLPAATGSTGPQTIVAGADGALWFTDQIRQSVLRMSTSGVVTGEFPTPTPRSNPEAIATGPDGNVWFTESQVQQIGRVNVAQADTLTATSTPLAVTEGQSVAPTLAALMDTDGNSNAASYSATIDWGDGTASSTGVVNAGSSGGFVVSGSHTYSEEGSFTARISLADIGDGSSVTASSAVSVSDAALTATGTTGRLKGKAFNGTVATVSDAGGAAAPTNYVATIAWGDGSSSQGSVTTSGSGLLVTGSHKYAVRKAYTVGVTIKDDGGSTVSTMTSLTLH